MAHKKSISMTLPYMVYLIRSEHVFKKFLSVLL